MEQRGGCKGNFIQIIKRKLEETTNKERKQKTSEMEDKGK
jgi:hypothetical protein